MDPIIGAALISSGSNLLGGFLGSKGKLSTRKTMRLQYDYQRLLNQTGVQDRVNDARAAGIHPVYAMGSNINPGSVQAVGDGSTGSSWQDSFSNMGQDLSRAASVYQSKEERQFQNISNSLTIERQSIENDILRADLALKRAGTAPGIVGGRPWMEGQGVVPGPNSDLYGVETIPKEVVANDGPFELGTSPAHQNLRFTKYRNMRAMSQALADAGLDEGPAQWYYQMSRTLPDMISADVKYPYDALKSMFSRWMMRGSYRTSKPYKAKRYFSKQKGY